MINPWEHPAGKKIWKTKAQFMSFVRGGIRRGLWERNPLKLQFVKDKRERVPLGKKTVSNPKGEVWGGRCEVCDNLFKTSDLQVDHIKGNHSLKTIEDLESFVQAMIFIDPDEDLQMICKPCHKAKSLAERKGISIEEAKATKKAIEIEKEKRVMEFLQKKGVTPESNQKKRRQQLIEVLLNDKD